MTRNYFALVERAAYYRHAAMRGWTLPGGDPETGAKRNVLDPLARAEARAAYKAMARVALAAATRARKGLTR